jgi:hypothetical protein
MPSTPLIAARVTITSKSINNDSVASVFTNVTNLNLDYYKGVVTVSDADQGVFPFGLSLVTSMTVTIAGLTTSVVMS